MSSSVSEAAMTAPVAAVPNPATPAKAPLFSAAAWAPLKVELFRSLWIATSVAQIGTWVREAAGPTLMESLTAGQGPVQAKWVAMVLFFSSLPIMLLSVFAGALADLLDRRRLLIWTQLWMVAVSSTLGVMTILGWVTPVLLLGMVFLLGVGTAAFGPALQAVLPELVPKQQFALAINLNSIALNVARAVGPALFIVVVMFVPGEAGAGVSFLLTALSFVGAVWVLLRWKRPAQRSAVEGEGFFNGIRAGFRYTVHSRANRAILLRVFAFIVPAVVIWSQIPIIATQQLGIAQLPVSAPPAATANPAAGAPSTALPSNGAASVTPASADPAKPAVDSAGAPRSAATQSRARLIQQVSALLYAFVGLGAVLGVLLMPGLHARYKIDPVVNVCTLMFALGLVALSFATSLWAAGPILVFLGINWVVIPTNFNTATQKSVPLWVKGRAISFYLTVLFGSFTLAAWIWGNVTAMSRIQVSLASGGIAMAAMLVLARRYPLTLNEGLDLSPAYPKGTEPLPIPGAADLPPFGRIELTRKYSIDPAQEPAVRKLLHEVGQLRKRNGASRWKLTRGKSAGHWVETTFYRSKAEFLRHYSRLTRSDIKLEEKANAYLAVSEPSPVTVRGENLWI